MSMTWPIVVVVILTIDIHASQASLLVLNEELSALTRSCSAQKIQDVDIVEYRNNVVDLEAIKHIMMSAIFFDKQEFPYAELLGMSAQTLINIYNYADNIFDETINMTYFDIKYAEQIARHGKRFMAKTKSGDVVGFGFVIPFTSDIYAPKLFEHHPTYKEWIIPTLAVDPNYRRLGIGRKLFDHMVTWAQDQSKINNEPYGYLHIQCDHKNKPACAAYRKWTSKRCKVAPSNTIICTKNLHAQAEIETEYTDLSCIVS